MAIIDLGSGPYEGSIGDVYRVPLVWSGTRLVVAPSVAEQASQLLSNRDRLIDRAIALLGIAGWFPTELRHDTSGHRTWIVDDWRMLACVALQQPKIGSDDYRFCLKLAFFVPPLIGL